MKIVDFETFVRMPAGTIFAPYKPCFLEDRLAIKVDEGKDSVEPVDLIYGSHWFNGVMSLEPWMGDSCLFEPGDQEPASFEIWDGDNNDYRDYDMFLIFEEADTDKLIRVLEWAKSGCVGDNPGEIEMEELS